MKRGGLVCGLVYEMQMRSRLADEVYEVLVSSTFVMSVGSAGGLNICGWACEALIRSILVDWYMKRSWVQNLRIGV